NNEVIEHIKHDFNADVLDFSTLRHTHAQFEVLVNLLQTSIPESAILKRTIIGDLISYGDVVLLITPIDSEAPEGRMILPQVQVIRDILDHSGIAVIVKEPEVDAFLSNMQPKPVLVITDSQVFPKADASIPRDIPLTSFSILLARQKGDFENYLKGTPYLGKLQDGDRLLILESCTHFVSCDDIGRIKIPRWLSNYTGKNLEFDVVAGLSALPRDIRDYVMVIQCGGCMITRKQLVGRLKPAIDAGIPVTNYGLAIAYVHGIYNRAVEVFLKDKNQTVDYL
ncbi:MAG: [FeFe] hydrogenase H-cluster maturation GTPase HydF, partial [Bacteroidales bacterium]|nr:[FeFe] hydrogenase H-cluster maturation GTPase HydF [Bacteroidales bacterium]